MFLQKLLFQELTWTGAEVHHGKWNSQISSIMSISCSLWMETTSVWADIKCAVMAAFQPLNRVTCCQRSKVSKALADQACLQPSTQTSSWICYNKNCQRQTNMSDNLFSPGMKTAVPACSTVSNPLYRLQNKPTSVTCMRLLNSLHTKLHSHWACLQTCFFYTHKLSRNTKESPIYGEKIDTNI